MREIKTVVKNQRCFDSAIGQEQVTEALWQAMPILCHG
jgi:hypothetical protein